MVCLLDLLGHRQLAADAAQRFGTGKAVSFLQAGNLGCSVCGDDDGLIDSLVDTGFEEQRDVVDDYRLRVFSCGLSRQSGLLSCDTRVNDCFERTAFCWMAKDDGTECLAIEAAVWVQDAPAECFHDLAPGRFARFHDVPSQFVGIDHDRAALFEHLGDGALARGDAACEADQDHGGGA